MTETRDRRNGTEASPDPRAIAIRRIAYQGAVWYRQEDVGAVEAAHQQEIARLTQERHAHAEQCADMQLMANEQEQRAIQVEAERDALTAQIAGLRAALQRLADCDWTIGRGDRMDPVREIARAALAATEQGGTDGD